jgi:hypothetical protein
MYGVGRAALFVLLSCGVLASRIHADQPSSSDIAFFESKVRPLLIKSCYECHSEQSKSVHGGLRLDTRVDALRGGDSGPAIIPGDPGSSVLIAAVRYSDDLQMPPDGKLPSVDVQLLEEWIERGAYMPDDRDPASSRNSEIDWEQARRFWSFQDLKKFPKPPITDYAWPQTKIDFFILAKLEENNLRPSIASDKTTLIRRAAFDITGLPPSPDEVKAFLNDDSPDAYERLIDRLLASPHYGERWGRYWLDMARYTDDVASWLQSTANAWRYRDWVVRAFNEDRDYRAFVKAQLAADMLEDAPIEDLAALGFLGISPTYWKELKLAPDVIKTVVAEEWEERIDAVTRTYLGLTVACARCHDHKFDPITTHDYYALAGVFASTRLVDRFLLPNTEAESVANARREVAAWEAEIEQLAKDKTNPTAAEKITELRKLVSEKKAVTPNYDAPQVCGVDDASIHVLPDGPDATRVEYRVGESLDLQIQLRGDPAKLGELAPRRFLRVFSLDEPPVFKEGSGRLEFAQAIVNNAGSLAARVIVNRVWSHHFGRGLVDTPSDFGAQGSPPSHPELLDDLAARFIEHGWSLKWLHREITLSATYRQVSGTHVPSNGRKLRSDETPSLEEAGSLVDPDNRWLWRMNRRRLEFEPWRDAMLAVSGVLDYRVGGSAQDLHDESNTRRTIYGRINRDDLEVTLRLYDFPDPASHSPHREATTTALQSLFVLNGPFVQRQSAALNERIAQEQPVDDQARIQRAYELLFSRAATEREVQLGLEFVSNSTEVNKAWNLYFQALLGTNEFFFID